MTTLWGATAPQVYDYLSHARAHAALLLPELAPKSGDGNGREPGSSSSSRAHGRNAAGGSLGARAPGDGVSFASPDAALQVRRARAVFPTPAQWATA